MLVRKIYLSELLIIISDRIVSSSISKTKSFFFGTLLSSKTGFRGTLSPKRHKPLRLSLKDTLSKNTLVAFFKGDAASQFFYHNILLFLKKKPLTLLIYGLCPFDKLSIQKNLTSNQKNILINRLAFF